MRSALATTGVWRVGGLGPPESTDAVQGFERVGQHEHGLLLSFDVPESLAYLFPLLQEWEPPLVAGADETGEALEFGDMLVAQRLRGTMFELVQDDQIGSVVDVLLQEAQTADTLLVRRALSQ
ncbi:hypothetical protein AB0M32_29785 [Streptomyces sp. NPDC051985]|uniref:hypothetical protein n=1 Tax=Streptomyces sp. NPDC051985 TaxID=3155807 RepID=UPI0034226D16